MPRYILNIGFAGVVIERITRQESVATQKQIVSEEQNRKINALLDERNQMIMLNSQFATVSGMSVFTGAIVHEITQPVQALVMAVDKAKHENGQDQKLKQSLEEIERHAEDCMSIIQSLRVIMSRGRTRVSLVDLCEEAREITPILKKECERRGIGFVSDIQPAPIRARLDPVLLKRIIINLASNAIEALAGNGTAQAELSICVRLEEGRAIIDVADNSGVVMDIQSMTFETLLETKKPAGMGLGLMLCSKIAEAWQGRLTAWQESGDARRTVFTLELPLAVS